MRRFYAVGQFATAAFDPALNRPDASSAAKVGGFLVSPSRMARRLLSTEGSAKALRVAALRSLLPYDLVAYSV
jgi:hypothetical protein